jgi:hypothetical protein
MTATIQYPVTVTLEASALLSQYCTLLARAALLRIERAEADAYWSSECGRARRNTMYCGEQDAVSDRLDRLTSTAEAFEATAASIAAALDAAGFRAPRVLNHEMLLESAVLDSIIHHHDYLANIREDLRDIIATGRSYDSRNTGSIVYTTNA